MNLGLTNSVQIKPLKSQDLGYYRFRIEGMFERDSTEDADTRAQITVPEDDLSDWGTFKYIKDDGEEELEEQAWQAHGGADLRFSAVAAGQTGIWVLHDARGEIWCQPDHDRNDP